MACQIIFETNIYNGKSKHIKSYQIHTGSTQTNTNTYYTHIIITSEAINQTPLAITFHDLGCPFNSFSYRIIKFSFQKSRYPNHLLDPVGESKLEPGLLRHFQSKHFVWFIKFLFSKVS